MSRLIAAAILFVPVALLQAAAPKDELVTKTYDVADLLHRQGGKSGYDSIDEVTRTIIELVNPKAWLLNGEGEGGYRLFVVNGVRLEIKASKKDHAEIGDLLQALRRKHDLAVDVKTTFYAVDAKWFDKEVRPKLDKKAPWIIDEKWAAFREHAEIVQTGKVRLANGRNGSIAGLHQVFSYIKPEPGDNGQPVWGAERIGIEYRLKPIVSADRRYVSLEMDEIARTLAAPKKGDLIPRIDEKKSPLTSKIADGESVAIAVPYQPQTVKDKGRILILYVQPLIYIEAEEKERRGKKDDG